MGYTQLLLDWMIGYRQRGGGAAFHSMVSPSANVVGDAFPGDWQ